MASAGRRETSLHYSQPYKLYLELFHLIFLARSGLRVTETADSVATDKKGYCGASWVCWVLFPFTQLPQSSILNALVFVRCFVSPGFLLHELQRWTWSAAVAFCIVYSCWLLFNRCAVFFYLWKQPPAILWNLPVFLVGDPFQELGLSVSLLSWSAVPQNKPIINSI